MADKPDAQAAPAAEAKKKLPIKTIIFILIMLVAEAGLIIGAISFFGRPSPVQGVDLAGDPAAEGDKLREVAVVHDKFVNNSTGRLWYWDAEVLVKVKRKHADALEAELKEREAEIRTGISAIVAGAQHTYFNEPGRETLSRQVLEFLRKSFGQDPQGDERIQTVLIPKCLGLPADF